MTTPDYVIQYNTDGGPDKFGGLHFGDPNFVPAYKVEDGTLYKAEAEKTDTVEDDNSDLAAWLRTQTWSEFAQSLAQFHADRGYLTEKQVTSATSMRSKIEARNATKTMEDTYQDEVTQQAAGLDLKDLPAGYYAVPGGDTRLKVRVKKLTKGKWAGFTFVDDGAAYGEQQKYGMQRPNDIYRGKIEDQLRKIVADPEAAGRAYAAITSRCYACNLVLEDELSVELGIGPICRSK